MKQAWIALGSNIAPRETYLQQAIQMLSEHEEIKLNQVSTVYETEPVGYENQDQFLNLVAEVETSLESNRTAAYLSKNRTGFRA